MQCPGTSVELHILITHLHSGSYEVVGTEEWVELPRWWTDPPKAGEGTFMNRVWTRFMNVPSPAFGGSIAKF